MEEGDTNTMDVTTVVLDKLVREVLARSDLVKNDAEGGEE